MAVRLLMAVLVGLLFARPTLAQERPGAGEYPALTSAGEVSLTVQPEWRDSVLAIRVSAESHTVELAGIDLVRSVRLMLDGAPAIAPARAGTLGGHHAAAEVVFRPQRRLEHRNGENPCC